MVQKARVAVIGTGWWATDTHIPGLQANTQAALVALCDNDPLKLKAAADAYQIDRVYEDYLTLLAQEALDGVVIATNHASHFKIAEACLNQGVHVMLEKPMTLHAPEAKALVDLAQRQGRELIIGYPYNYMPYALRAREVIQNGELGPIQYINGVFNSNIINLLRGEHDVTGAVHGPGTVYSDPEKSGGGHGHLQLTHPLGLIFFITGLRAQRVHALMQQHGLALDLVDAIIITFEAGAVGTIGGTGNLANAGGRKFDLQIYCERGSIDMDVIEGTTLIYRPSQPPESVEPATPERADYRRFYTSNNLVEVILGHAENGSPAEIGWRAVEVLDAAYRSAAQDGRGIAVTSLYA